MEIDLILLYISGLTDKLLKYLCARLETACLQTPILVFGTEDECKDFDNYCPIAISKYMHRPIAAQDISKAIYELIEKDPQMPPVVEEVVGTAEIAETPQPDDSKKHMSLADFADSLESDNRRCLLLVDDDGRILRALKMLLEKTYRINLANSGISAIASIERERPDAVLLDYEMPMVDGKKTLEMIRQNQKTQDLPVFFLTGVADKERIKDVIHLRPQGYLLKSSEQSVLLDTLEKFFNS